MKTFGRDKNGMFNNHQNYMKLRNKINEQEEGHAQMFDTISKKLTDHTFIQQAIEISSEAELKGEGGKKNSKEDNTPKNSVSSKSDAGMSDADVKCYEKRVGDLDGKSAREHFLEIGSDEGIWNHCGQNLTNYQS